MVFASILKDLKSLMSVSSIDEIDINSSHKANIYAGALGTLILTLFLALFIYYDPNYYRYPIFFILALFPFLWSCLFFSDKKHHFRCAITMYLVFTTFLAVMSMLFFGKELGIHNYHLVLSLLPLISFKRERWITIALILLLNFGLYLYIQLVWIPTTPLLVFPKSLEKINFLTSMILFGMTFTILILDRQIIAQKHFMLRHLAQELSVKNTELENAVATKDKFISLIAHDLKGPVGNLSNFLELLSDKLTTLTKDELYDSLYVLKTSSRNTYDLLENLLNWSRIQTGDISFSPVKGDLCTIVSNNIELFKPISFRKGITLEYNPNGPNIVSYDTNMLNTVVRNLLNNAVKYTNSGGKIVVTCNNNNDKAEIYIEDNGVGMDRETLENLFRLDIKRYPSTGTAGESGTGLGLIMCNEFIHRHGGVITAESTKGKGSKFTISLPMNN